MNKKANTIVFMIVATLVNLLLLAVFFIIGFLILNFVISKNPETTLAPLLIGVIFLGSIALSFLCYSKMVAFFVGKFNLEDKMDPLFGKNKKIKKQKEEE